LRFLFFVIAGENEISKAENKRFLKQIQPIAISPKNILDFGKKSLP
jgi:hypothetical protein